MILSEIGKDRFFLGSSTPAGFMNEVDIEATFFRDEVRRSVPTPPLSKIVCLAVFDSFNFWSCSKPLSCPDVPEADIDIGLGCIFRFEDDSGEPTFAGVPESWSSSGVEA
jgi:hypothetical protein